MGAVACPVTADKIIATAASQVGVAESPHGSNKQKFGEWYGLNGVAWCAIFVSYVMHHAGWDDFAISTPKGFSYCPAGADWFKQRGAWAGKSTVPKRGWIVFFDFPGDGVNRISHTGIVEGVLPDGRIATIEGNTSDAGGRTGGIVMRHNRTPAGGIVGYGALQFPSNTEDDVMDAQQYADFIALLKQQHAEVIKTIRDQTDGLATSNGRHIDALPGAIAKAKG